MLDHYKYNKSSKISELESSNPLDEQLLETIKKSLSFLNISLNLGKSIGANQAWGGAFDVFAVIAEASNPDKLLCFSKFIIS